MGKAAARAPMTLEEIRASRPDVDRTKIAATTEEDIRRHQIEDSEDPDAPLPPFQPVPNVRAMRAKLRIAEREPEAALRALGG